MTSSNGSERVEFWRGFLKEQRQSGLSVKAFCAAKNVSEPSFYHWKRKLVPPPPMATNKKRDSSTQMFVPVQLVPTQPASVQPSPTIQIFTPSGFTLRVDASTSHRDLSTLLRAIEDASVRGERC